VPPQEYSGVTGFFLSVWRKLEWMLLTLFMPELLLARALASLSLRAIRWLCPDMQQYVYDDTWWCRVQYFFKRHGTRRPQDTPGENAAGSDEGGESGNRTSAAGKRKKWTRTHAFYANMGGFILDEPDATPPPNSVLHIMDWAHRFVAMNHE
jgi:hypothetical protein